MLAVDVDLCTARELKDPENGKLMTKTLTILSTSSSMMKGLIGLRCSGLHDHQTIEGQVRYQGQWITRPSFTEHDPRKFAGTLALLMGKVHKPAEAPYRNEMWSILASEGHPEAQQPKRARVSRYPSTKLSRALAVAKLSSGKRRKMHW